MLSRGLYLAKKPKRMIRMICQGMICQNILGVTCCMFAGWLGSFGGGALFDGSWCLRVHPETAPPAVCGGGACYLFSPQGAWLPFCVRWLSRCSLSALLITTWDNKKAPDAGSHLIIYHAEPPLLWWDAEGKVEQKQVRTPAKYLDDIFMIYGRKIAKHSGHR